MISSLTMKSENSTHSNYLIQVFCHVVLDCNLHYLSMEGYKYTWARRHGKFDGIEEKFDTALLLWNGLIIFQISNSL